MVVSAEYCSRNIIRFLNKEKKVPLHRYPKIQIPASVTYRDFCREEGIRTLDTLLEYTRFPGVRLQPLGHLSFYFMVQV